MVSQYQAPPDIESSTLDDYSDNMDMQMPEDYGDVDAGDSPVNEDNYDDGDSMANNPEGDAFPDIDVEPVGDGVLDADVDPDKGTDVFESIHGTDEMNDTNGNDIMDEFEVDDSPEDVIANSDADGDGYVDTNINDGLSNIMDDANNEQKEDAPPGFSLSDDEISSVKDSLRPADAYDQNAGPDRSMEYRGMPQNPGHAPRGGRGGAYMRR